MNRLPILLLAALLVIYRLFGAAYPDTLPNFQPLPALLLCSLVFLDTRLRWTLPLGVWLLTDPLVSLLQGAPILGWHHLALLIGLAATVGVAWFLGRRPRAIALLGGSVVAALGFYFLTNLISFATLPLYPKSLEGFVQAQWTGPIGFGPTWLFLRNLLASNVLFTALVLAACVPLPRRAKLPALAAGKH